MDNDVVRKLADLLKKSRLTLALTGAGISKASGIPPFRGEDGIWNKYDPRLLELNYFYSHPEESWEFMAETFFEFYEEAKPNPTHIALAELEELGYLKGVITQNIDCLHQSAGSKKVWEYHGGLNHLICTKCGDITPFNRRILEKLPPSCSKCQGLLKPKIVFFSEAIPVDVSISIQEVLPETELLLVIGTSAEVYPASLIPSEAKHIGAEVVEINPEETSLTSSVTDLFMGGKAEEILPAVLEIIKSA